MGRLPESAERVLTRYWHPLPGGSGRRVQCDLCPRGCKLEDGQRGLCFVRGNAGGAVVLTAWGRTSGFCVDPIEKKPLYHFLPGSAVLSFGTAGCNLTCRFCQNWDISKSREEQRLSDRATPEAIAGAAVRLRCAAVAFTYNEPAISHEYVADVADACRARGIRTVAVTAGYVSPEPRAEFYRRIDAANVDLKSFRDRFYHELCSAHLAPVLDTLRYLRHETGVWLEITNLLIPGENDSDTELDELSGWVVAELGPDVPLHFSAFHPAYRLLDRPATPAATLRRARATARRNGVRYVYLGNVRDADGATTFCPACGAALIERDGFALAAWRLHEGACPACGERPAGHFEARPGGGCVRPRPVRLASD